MDEYIYIYIYKGLDLKVGKGEGDVLMKRGLKMQRGEEWHKEVFTCPFIRMHWTRLRKRTFSTNTRFCLSLRLPFMFLIHFFFSYYLIYVFTHLKQIFISFSNIFTNKIALKRTILNV